eukprot:scaffold3055_cov143-Cylindrotheca_fusiformis.AAC.3
MTSCTAVGSTALAPHTVAAKIAAPLQQRRPDRMWNSHSIHPLGYLCFGKKSLPLVVPSNWNATMKWLRQFEIIILVAHCTTSFYLVPGKRSPAISCCYLSETQKPYVNEFSRKLDTDKILKTASGNRRRARDYALQIAAEKEEREKLATRFDLKMLHGLWADVSVRPCEAHRHSKSRGLIAVFVEGTVNANLTQTCVRTNDDFLVNVEFTFQSVVKPIANNFLSEDNDGFEKTDKVARGKRLKNNQMMNLDDIVKFQDILEDVQEGDDDLLIEDESIYSLLTGTLDVGELVAQLFWLHLDPYPKKPGSDPIEISITG